MTKLEEAMGNMQTTTNDLETLLYKIGDSPTPATEDELMNIVIGIIELNKCRYEQMWVAHENECTATINNKLV